MCQTGSYLEVLTLSRLQYLLLQFLVVFVSNVWCVVLCLVGGCVQTLRDSLWADETQCVSSQTRGGPEVRSTTPLPQPPAASRDRPVLYCTSTTTSQEGKDIHTCTFYCTELIHCCAGCYTLRLHCHSLVDIHTFLCLTFERVKPFEIVTDLSPISLNSWTVRTQ